MNITIAINSFYKCFAHNLLIFLIGKIWLNIGIFYSKYVASGSVVLYMDTAHRADHLGAPAVGVAQETYYCTVL
jgi:hypothetical protein